MTNSGYTLEEILKAQPLNPLVQLRFTAMPRFPLIQPSAEPVVMSIPYDLRLVQEVNGDLTWEETQLTREQQKAAITQTYSQLDEVI